MKSIPLCRNNNNGGSTGAVAGGRVNRNKRGDLEDEKIQKYLSKLKDLVPLIPKDKRISRLEVIHHVIDYICDLEDMLENHRSVNADAVHSAAAAVMLSSSVAAVRQPLGIISTPNALAAAAVAVAAQPQSSSEPVSYETSIFDHFPTSVNAAIRACTRHYDFITLQKVPLKRIIYHYFIVAAPACVFPLHAIVICSTYFLFEFHRSARPREIIYFFITLHVTP